MYSGEKGKTGVRYSSIYIGIAASVFTKLFSLAVTKFPFEMRLRTTRSRATSVSRVKEDAVIDVTSSSSIHHTRISACEEEFEFAVYSTRGFMTKPPPLDNSILVYG